MRLAMHTVRKFRIRGHFVYSHRILSAGSFLSALVPLIIFVCCSFASFINDVSFNFLYQRKT